MNPVSNWRDVGNNSVDISKPGSKLNRVIQLSSMMSKSHLYHTSSSKGNSRVPFTFLHRGGGTY